MKETYVRELKYLPGYSFGNRRLLACKEREGENIVFVDGRDRERIAIAVPISSIHNDLVFQIFEVTGDFVGQVVGKGNVISVISLLYDRKKT